MNRYQTKNYEKNEYRTLLGTTDYNIPMFGYRSAIFIFGIVMGVVLLIMGACQAFEINSQVPLLVGISLAFGSSIAYSQYFMERKKGLTKGFYLTILWVSCFCGLLLYLVFFQNGMI